MVMAFQVKADIREVRELLKDVEQKIIPSVLASSLTTVARQIRTGALSDLKGSTGIPSSILSKRIRIFRANPRARNIQASLYLNTRDIPVITLGAKQKGKPGRRPKKSRRNRGGVTAGNQTYLNAFIGSPKNQPGNPQVFQRITKKADPLRVLRVSIEDQGDKAISRRLSVSGQQWRSIFEQRLATALNRRGQTRASAFVGGGL